MIIGRKQMTAALALAAATMLAVAPTASATNALAPHVASPAMAGGLHGSPAHGWCPWHGHWCPRPS